QCRCPAHGPRPRGDPRARWCGALERVHASDAGTVRIYLLARGPDEAVRDRAVAAVVSLPPRQNVLLEPHRHRAPPGTDGATAARAQSKGDRHRRALPRAAADDASRAEGAAAEGDVVLVLP